MKFDFKKQTLGAHDFVNEDAHDVRIAYVNHCKCEKVGQLGSSRIPAIKQIRPVVQTDSFAQCLPGLLRESSTKS